MVTDDHHFLLRLPLAAENSGCLPPTTCKVLRSIIVNEMPSSVDDEENDKNSNKLEEKKNLLVRIQNRNIDS